MVEPEMVWADLAEITNLAEKLIKQVISYILKNNNSELEFLEKYQKHNNKEITAKLEKLVKSEFKKIDYRECLEILEKNKENFVFDDIK